MTQWLTSRLLQSIALLMMTIGMAVMRWRFEHFSGTALSIVIVSAGLMGISLLAPIADRSAQSERLILPLLILSLLVAMARLPMIELVWQDRRLAAQAIPYFASILAWVAIVIVMALDRRAKIAPILFGLLLVWHAMVGLWFLAKSAEPKIDVYLIQAMGADSLMHGVNPFAITFPDIYGPHAHFYPPGIVANGRVQCGYFYLPMSLLLALPGYLCGDVRYTNLVSLLIAASLIAYARPSRVSFLCGALVLFCPGMFFMLINAWIEPQMLMILAGVVFVAIRRLRFSGVIQFVLLGMLLAEKQYLILVVPLIRLLVPDRGMKHLIRAGAIAGLTASVIILPFFIWDPRAFLHSATALYVNLLRTDAISIPAWLKLKFDIQLHLFITAGAGIVAAIATAWRGRRTPATFAAAMAFVLTVSFFFSTQAFLNYYFFATGCLCVALAAGDYRGITDNATAEITADVMPSPTKG